jgi:hypothetical protein
VKLSPLEVGGIVGALLGIPAAAALKVASGEVPAWRRGEDAPKEPEHRRSAAAARQPRAFPQPISNTADWCGGHAARPADPMHRSSRRVDRVSRKEKE